MSRETAKKIKELEIVITNRVAAINKRKASVERMEARQERRRKRLAELKAAAKKEAS